MTCTFTNTKSGKIVVAKQTNPDGDPQSFAFSASYDQAGFSLSDGQSTTRAPRSGHVLGLRERAGGMGPRLGDLRRRLGSRLDRPRGRRDGDVHFRQREGREDRRPQGDEPEGDPQSFSFNASYDADGFSLSDGQSNDSGDLDPGTYSVSETVPQGWDLDSATCDDGSPEFDLPAAGETVTCTFINEKDSHIVVRKMTNPSPDPQLFAFSASYAQCGFSLADGQSNDSGDLDPGTYSVSENVPRAGISRRRLLGREPRRARSRCRPARP